MNIDDLTLAQVKEIGRLLNLQWGGSTTELKPIDNHMIGKYVIVRCHDAGVHAGVLESYNGRECVLTESRRLWYWKAASGAFLSGVAANGLHSSSKVGEPIRVHLTETCEIIECSDIAKKSIRGVKNYEP